MNTPKYTSAELLDLVTRVARVKLTSGIPESYLNAIEAQGPYAKAILTSAGPCMPTSVSIATGQSLDKVCDKMQAVYTEGTKKAPTVLDGTTCTFAELKRIPNVLRAAVKGCPNRDFIRREDLEGSTLTGLMKSGRTFVALVAGGAHAVAVKRGKLYCTAGKTSRQKTMFVYEVV